MLARELIKMGLLNVTSGANPVAIKKGIDKTVAALIEELRERARPVQGRETIRGSMASNLVPSCNVYSAHDEVRCFRVA